MVQALSGSSRRDPQHLSTRRQHRCRTLRATRQTGRTELLPNAGANTHMREGGNRQPEHPGVSARYRGHCHPGTGAASEKCHPATGATMSTMNRDCTPAPRYFPGKLLTSDTDRHFSNRPKTALTSAYALVRVCRRGDLNPHALAGTSPSSWRVYLFRHSDVAFDDRHRPSMRGVTLARALPILRTGIQAGAPRRCIARDRDPTSIYARSVRVGSRAASPATSPGWRPESGAEPCKFETLRSVSRRRWGCSPLPRPSRSRRCRRAGASTAARRC
jgi:hypothetical protein